MKHGSLRLSNYIMGAILALASVSCNDRSIGDPVTPIEYAGDPAALTTGEREVVISPSSINLNVGQQQQATAAIYRDGVKLVSDATYVWSSLNSQIASVSQLGVVTGRAVGSTKIVAAQTCCGRADTVVVTVQQLAGSIVATPHTLSLLKGDSARVTAAVKDAAGVTIANPVLTWTSSKPAVATVNGGMVKGVSAGTGVIYVSSGTFKDSTVVTVAAGTTTPVLTTVAVTPATAAVSVSGTVQLSAAARDQNGQLMTGQTFAWSSSNPQVASVSATGLVKGLAAGTVSIAASAGGKVGTAQVTVTTTQTPPPSGSFNPPNIAFTNFDAGNSSPFKAGNGLTTGSADIKFIADPTGKFGAGKVMQVHYARTSTASTPDVDRNVLYKKGIHWSQTVFMRGHVLIPTPQSGMTGAMRKLMYVMTAAPSKSFCVIRANGSTLYAEFSGTTSTSRVATIGAFPFGVKHSIEVQITVNSAAGVPNGTLRVWLNGVLATDLHDVNWIKAPDAATNFNTFKFGQQTQNTTTSLFDEVRYWDNIALSTTRIGP